MNSSTSAEPVVRSFATGSKLLARGHRNLPMTLALIMFSWAAPAQADPCEGRLPSAAGQKFEGLVRYVGDGDSLCVGQAGDPRTWIEVRLADFDAPELHAPEGRRAKALLKQVAFGRRAECEAHRGHGGRVISYDRVIAVCRVDGRSIGDLLRATK